jgi:hypothetical protein
MLEHSLIKINIILADVKKQVHLLWTYLYLCCFKSANVFVPSNNNQTNSSISFCGSYSQVKTLNVELNNEAVERLKIFVLFRVQLCWNILL